MSDVSLIPACCHCRTEPGTVRLPKRHWWSREQFACMTCWFKLHDRGLV